MMAPRKQTRIIKIIQVIFSILFMLALIFVPAGTWNWPEAWIFLIFYTVVGTAAVVWLKTKTPDLLKERQTKKKDSKTWDKIFMRAYTVMLIFLMIIPGLDAVRYGWSRVPPALKVAAFIGYLPALIMAFWALIENRFASDVVRIQKERGHSVCTTGPYRYVRHPMYVGAILIFLFFPVSLGSYFGLVPAIIIIVLFFIRTALEDKTLLEELPGYREYAQKVRYRLIPGIW
jgi:protein-S-isoprenylcysteine O-methyltransferase Ste14